MLTASSYICVSHYIDIHVHMYAHVVALLYIRNNNVTIINFHTGHMVTATDLNKARVSWA